MKRLLRRVFSSSKSRAGQSLTEYALILAFIAMVAVVILRGVGTATNAAMAPVPNALSE